MKKRYNRIEKNGEHPQKTEFTMNLKDKKINFLGDSITEGVGTSEKSKIYLNLLKARAELAEVRNYGKSGTRIARQIHVTDHPFDQDFNLRAETMDDDADIVVVFGGTNDFGHGEVPIGSMDDRTLYTFYGAMHALVLKLLHKYTDKKLVFMTPLHRMNENASANTQKFEGVSAKPLYDYVKAIREVCEYYSVPVLDLYRESGIAGNVKVVCDIYMPDGLHPNDLGHEIIAHKLQKFLENL